MKLYASKWSLGDTSEYHSSANDPMHALDAMITKLYPGIQKAVHPFRFKNFEHVLLGSGVDQKVSFPPV